MLASLPKRHAGKRLLICHDCLEGAGYLFRKELIHGIKCLANKHHDQSQHEQET